MPETGQTERPPGGGPRMHRLEHIMGMPIAVDVCDPHPDAVALDRMFQWLRFVDATFSTYREDSEISRLNRGEISLGQTHSAVRSVLRRCEQLRRETDGYFDIRAPVSRDERAAAELEGRIDPSGLVKGWAVAGAARILDLAGARNYCVNAGGDVRLRGRSWEGALWRVGIQHPLIRDRLAAVLTASEVGIATSGAYERGEHIVNPHTGATAQGLLSVTVVGPDIATADAYATAAYAMGARASDWCLHVPGYAAMLILTEGRVLFTPAMNRYCT